MDDPHALACLSSKSYEKCTTSGSEILPQGGILNMRKTIADLFMIWQR